jgi:hypothetical protein
VTEPTPGASDDRVGDGEEVHEWVLPGQHSGKRVVGGRERIVRNWAGNTRTAMTRLGAPFKSDRSEPDAFSEFSGTTRGIHRVGKVTVGTVLLPPESVDSWRAITPGRTQVVHSGFPGGTGSATAGSQQIRGSGSPTSMSTMRVPPNMVRSTTIPGGSLHISPMMAASLPRT